MKIELKHKILPIEKIFAFRFDNNIGFIDENGENFIIWWDGQKCPSVSPVLGAITIDLSLKDVLINSGIIENDVIISNIWSKDDFELIFREI